MKKKSELVVGIHRYPDEMRFREMMNKKLFQIVNKKMNINVIQMIETVDRYREILNHNGIKYINLDINDDTFWDDVKNVDLFLFRYGQTDHMFQYAHALIYVIENELGVKCFPNYRTIWHFDNKIREYYLMQAHGFPMIKTWAFYDRAKAMEWIKTAEFPAVFKLKGGAGSRNVLIVKDKAHAKKLVNLMFNKGAFRSKIPDKSSLRQSTYSVSKHLRQVAVEFVKEFQLLASSTDWQIDKNYIMFQKFLPGNDFDTRITVIGDRAFGFRRFLRDGDFRASGSGKINYETDKVDKRCIKIAFEVSKKMGFQSMAYDFMLDADGEPQFCEISYSYSDKAIHNCPGYWDCELNWHEGNFWPNYLHLADALEMKSLKQPDNL